MIQRLCGLDHLLLAGVTAEYVSFHAKHFRCCQTFADNIQRNLIIIQVARVRLRLNDILDEHPGVEGWTGTPAIAYLTEDDGLACQRHDLDPCASPQRRDEL